MSGTELAASANSIVNREVVGGAVDCVSREEIPRPRIYSVRLWLAEIQGRIMSERKLRRRKQDTSQHDVNQ